LSFTLSLSFSFPTLTLKFQNLQRESETNNVDSGGHSDTDNGIQFYILNYN